MVDNFFSTEQRELWQRLSSFEFNDPSSEFPFVAKLKHTQGWSQEFAARAIGEYRRFAFLAVASGHPVSPSHVIDEVWHLHLIYTESYWNEFCPNVLRQPLHHSPSKGGKVEHDKFQKMRAQTLASYRRFFGCEPPDDIWSDTSDGLKFSRTCACRKHRTRNFDFFQRIFPRSTPQAVAKFSIPILCLTFAGAGCQSLGELGGLNMKGGEFLAFFLPLAVISQLLGFILWRLQTAGASFDAKSAASLSLYEVAYLSGGASRVASVALHQLLNQEHLQLHRATRSIAANSSPSSSAHPLERSVWLLYRCRKGTGPLSWIELAKLKTHVEVIKADLCRSKLCWTMDELLKKGALAFALSGIVFTLGLAKFVVGFSRGKPVGFLFVALFMMILSTAIILSRGYRTKAARAALENVRSEVSSSPESKAFQFALLGLAGLSAADLYYDVMRQSVRQPQDGSGSGCGSSCSSGGGGGCGGGGCGGCGGGD